MDISFVKFGLFINSYFGVLIAFCAAAKSVLFAFNVLNKD